jgi:thiamine-monophosphate kinase
MLSEFDIIRTCFDQPGLAAVPGNVVRLGIGDDCALLAIPAGMELALSMDTLVEGVHFPAGANPELVAWRALAVNLSDLAAMGAEPAGFTLALTLPAADQGWLEKFSTGLKACAGEYHCPLLGGDITRGPLTITIQVHGLVDAGKAITRSGAVPGDCIYITGSLGESALAINLLLNPAGLDNADRERWEQTFYRPLPRLTLGMAAAAVVTAGIDISDGLLADLGHICRLSRTGARLSLPAIPLATPLQKYLPLEEALVLAVTGGDDYELLLTVSPAREDALLALGRTLDVPLHKIGEIISGEGVQCLDGSGRVVDFPDSGYRHFS